MRNPLLPLAVACLAARLLLAAPPYANGPRDEINLAGDTWQEAIADTVDLGKLPENPAWTASTVPTKGTLSKKLKSSDNQWQYCNVAPEKYFDKDGAFKVKEKRSAWFKRTVEIPAELLKNHTVHLTAAGMSYRSAVFVNGRHAGESIQACLPVDIDLTPHIKPGANELTLAITTREGLVDPKAQVYLAPSMGATVGIRGPVRLEFRPLTAVDDVFVKTSVKAKTADFQITLKNNAAAPVEVTPSIKIRSARDPQQVVGEFTGQPVKLAPGSETVTNLKENWVAPILWSLTTPEIYIADVSLFSGGQLVDNYRQTFGFREFTTQGKDFLLNGNRVVMLRDSSLNALKTLESNPDEISVTQKASPINTIRQHLGTYNSDLIHRANQQGIMVVPESAYSWTNIYPQAPEKAKVWLPGVLEYYKGWARLLRNEPSVVLYSLVNETYWERNLPDEMAVAQQIVGVMRQADPTRPLQGDGENSWNGLLDVINIHYPEGRAGPLRLQYTNAGLAFPNDLDWLTADGGEGWNTKFKWDRPLVLGEFGPGVADDLLASSTGGDEIYNWIRWRKIARSGRDTGASDRSHHTPSFDVLRKWINHYRFMGVAGLNPWTGDEDEVLKAATVVPLDFHPNVDAGGVFKRHLAVFNDEKRPLNKIKYYLTVDGVIVCDQEIALRVAPGQKWDGFVEIPVPKLDRPAKAEFLARLIWTRGKQDIEMDRHVETVHIVPPTDLSALTKQVAVIDPEKSLGSALGALKLDGAQAVQGDTVPAGKKVLVIGVNAFRDSMGKALDQFVEAGGTVLMLPQKDWKPYRVELPERDPRHAATQAWVRASAHPALKGLEEAQFSYWNDDNVVSYETFKKPQQGPLTPILDTGGSFGLIWSPLLDIPVGKGTFLMTTLELTRPEPVARQLLANLIEYGCSRKPASFKRLNLMAGSNEALAEVLKLTGIQSTEGVGASGPVLVDATATFNVRELQKALDQDRTLWLHGFTPETLPKIAALLPADAKLAPVPKELIGTMPVAQDELLQGLANFDFTWYIPKLYSDAPLFDGASVVAKTGDWTLNTSLFASGVKPLTSPAFLVKLNSGKGAILFDTLQWDKALASESGKVLRIASAILTNLGGEFKFPKKVEYQYSFVDFSKTANMAFMDSKPDDGVGGWTDEGRNDMRFFLINHSGHGNGEEDGMEVPVQDFPTKVEFEHIPYKLIDPKANHGKAVLSFGSDEHGSKLMRECGPIPVNAKASKLWILHAIGWAGGKAGDVVAEYTVTYDDGSTATIPVRRFVDVGDWHSPSIYSNAAIAWTGKNLVTSPVGLNAMTWKNPHPEKTIKTLALKAGLTKSQYVVVAITLGLAPAAGEPVALDLDFEDPSGNSSLLTLTATPPVQTPQGLAFAHGSAATFSAKKAGLADFLKQPFSIRFDLTATDAPDGFCGGLIESGPFRITLGKSSMKVTVETFGFDGKRLNISSHDPVELNRRVSFEYKATGKKGILLRNGKIDAIVDAPLPNNSVDQIRLGVAGGKDYNFNGTLHRIVWTNLPPSEPLK